MPSEIIFTGIEDATLELQPLFGDLTGGVLHLLPGGSKNPEWFPSTNSKSSLSDLLDVYAFFAYEKNKLRGGHYHLKLNEMFFTVAGTALWILSDFRHDSTTRGQTVAFILGTDKPAASHHLPTYTINETNKLARLRVPAGVYHAVIPITDEGFVCIALGTTPYDQTDYRYPTIDEVLGMREILKKFTIELKFSKP